MLTKTNTSDLSMFEGHSLQQPLFRKKAAYSIVHNPYDLKHLIQSFKKAYGPKALVGKWRSLALAGTNVQCPCCNKSFVTFLPAGLKKRANAKCAHCHSLERHRITWLYLLQQTDFFKKPIKVLNIAPEAFYYKKFSTLPNVIYFPVDKYPEDFGYGLNTIRMDVSELCFEDNTFDVIICNHVLEHVENDRQAIYEMHRVLKPGGYAILNSPVDKKRATTFEDPSITDPQERAKMFGQKDHVRVYGRDYINRLIGGGFKPEVVDYVKTFTAEQRFKYGIKAGDDIYLCRKG